MTGNRPSKAAVLTAYGEPLEVREFAREPPETGGIVVEIECATMCGSDVHKWQGALAGSFGGGLPVIPGHEATGRVQQLGEGVRADSLGRDLRIGDRVIWTHASCGSCPVCVLDRAPGLCDRRQVGFHTSLLEDPRPRGTFSELVHVWPGADVLLVPDGVESTWASAGSCALRTIVAALERLGSVDGRDDVLIQGSGPLGLFATAMIATRSPRSLTVVGGPADRLALAAEWGATSTINVEEVADPDQRSELIRSSSDGRGASAIIEASGAPGVFSEGVRAARPLARYVLVGRVSGEPELVPVPEMTRKNLKVMGSLDVDVRAYHRALDFLMEYRHRFDWGRMFGRTYRLDQATDALEAMRRGEEMKPVLVPGKRNS